MNPLIGLAQGLGAGFGGPTPPPQLNPEILKLLRARLQQHMHGMPTHGRSDTTPMFPPGHNPFDAGAMADPAADMPAMGGPHRDEPVYAPNAQLGWGAPDSRLAAIEHLMQGFGGAPHRPIDPGFSEQPDPGVLAALIAAMRGSGGTPQRAGGPSFA